MASLTPGVLSKLIENVGDRDAKIAGEYRSVLLQVIGIVPSLAGGDDNDPWRSKGFYLRVSDSVHSAYVSVSDEDTDLILSDKIQLGQFIHVTRLDSGSPVPVLRGVKPVPRRRPCVGDPKDLISSDSLLIRTQIDFSRTPKRGLKSGKKGGLVKRAEPKDKAKTKKIESNESNPRRQSLGSGKGEEGLEMRRMSLDSARKGWDRSPGRSKIAEVGLMSRFKPKTPSSSDSVSVHSSKKASSSEKDFPVKPRTMSLSPLKNKNVIVSQTLLSKPVKNEAKPSNDVNPPSRLIKVHFGHKTWSSDIKILWDSLPSGVHDLAKGVMYHRNAAFLSAVRALEEASATEDILQCMSVFAELCESSGKDSAGPLVEQFLNLHQKIRRTAAVIDVLFNKSQELNGCKYPSPQSPLPEICENSINGNASLWIEAAVQTDLSRFSLFTKEDKRDISHGGKRHFVILDTSSNRFDSENHSPSKTPSQRNCGDSMSHSGSKRLSSHSRQRLLSSTKKNSPEKEEWPRCSGLKEAFCLAEKLISASRAWFLNYLEDSLKMGFGLNREEGGSEVTILLGQLKRVNQWLDEAVGNGNGFNERIEGLKKKLYGFLLEHVDSAVVSSK